MQKNSQLVRFIATTIIIAAMLDLPTTSGTAYRRHVDRGHFSRPRQFESRWTAPRINFLQMHSGFVVTWENLEIVLTAN
jgi:hypothetical protein